VCSLPHTQQQQNASQHQIYSLKIFYSPNNQSSRQLFGKSLTLCFNKEFKFNTKLFLVIRKDYKDTDSLSPKSAYINWSLPGSGNNSWRTLTAPKLPRDRLSCKEEKLFSRQNSQCIQIYQSIFWYYEEAHHYGDTIEIPQKS